MRILVTGGAGYIGSHTVKELIKNKDEVVVYDNLSEGHLEAVNPKAELVVGDLGETVKLEQVFKTHQPQAVIHFAGFIKVRESVENPGKYFFNNFCFGVNLLEIMAKNGIKQIVFSSSAGVYGNPQRVPVKEEDPTKPVNTYGLAKLMFEGALDSFAKAYGIKYHALRYFNAAGASRDGEIGEDHHPETHIIPLILEVAAGKRDHFEIFGSDYPTPDGTCIRDYIHVEDLAKAHLAALERLLDKKQSAIYNLGVGKGFSNLEVIKTAEKITGQKIKINKSARRAGNPARLVADSSRAQKELNWRPKYQKLDDIIATAWAWHKSHPSGYEKPI